MFRSIFNGRGAQDLREMPDHIAEVDHVVCTAPPDIRIMLIKFYGSRGTYYEKAVALGLDKRTFKRRLDRADYYAHSLLDAIPQKGVQVRQSDVSDREPSRVAIFSRHISLNIQEFIA